MVSVDTPTLALVVARDLGAVSEALGRSGLNEAAAMAGGAPSIPHRTVVIDNVDGRHALCRLAAANGWMVLLAPAVAYRRATTLLILATRLPTSRRVLHVDELLMYQVLAASTNEEQEALVNAVLAPVLALPPALGNRLLTTLEALHWNDGSAKSTARALGLHSKTVLNRVRRFEALTGLSLDRPPDRLRADVALYVLRMRGRLARVEIERGATPADAPRGNGNGILRASRVGLAAAPS
ncbi:MAG TPA: helix-turn-helix domain-containing protein [Acidimicrobiales bacterium]|nr:helix-turn-helix domain-containing protein [Acidimicrobiales bacterium]